jgi:hypothetical protein
MTAAAPSPNREQLLALLRGFLIQILPSGVEVVVGQANRVPEPLGDSEADFVVMTPLGLRRLATTVDTWPTATDPPPTTLAHEQDVEAEVQLDVHGAGSTDNVNLITTLLRSAYACEFFAGSGVAPLYCDDGLQIPFISGEDQYEDRWVVKAFFEMSVTTATPAQFADEITVTPVSVDVLEPP